MAAQGRQEDGLVLPAVGVEVDEGLARPGGGDDRAVDPGDPALEQGALRLAVDRLGRPLQDDALPFRPLDEGGQQVHAVPHVVVLGVEEDLDQSGVGGLVRQGAEGGVDRRLPLGRGARLRIGPGSRSAAPGGRRLGLDEGGPLARADEGPGALGEPVEAAQLPVGAQALQLSLPARSGVEGAVVVTGRRGRGEAGQVAEGVHPLGVQQAGLRRGDVRHEGQALPGVALVQAVGVEEAAVALEREGEGHLVERLGGDAGDHRLRLGAPQEVIEGQVVGAEVERQQGLDGDRRALRRRRVGRRGRGGGLVLFAVQDGALDGGEGDPAAGRHLAQQTDVEGHLQAVLDALVEAGLDVRHGDPQAPLAGEQADEVGGAAAGPGAGAGAEVADQGGLGEHQPAPAGGLVQRGQRRLGAAVGQIDHRLAGGADAGDDPLLERLAGGVQQGRQGLGADPPARFEGGRALRVEDEIEQAVAVAEADVLRQGGGAETPAPGPGRRPRRGPRGRW